MNAHRIRRGIGRVFFGLSVFALISPAILVFLWMLSLSLKNEVDNMSFVPVFIPNPPTLNNFIEVFERNDFLTYTINSVIVSFGATGLALLLGVPAGFGIAKAKAHRVASDPPVEREAPGGDVLPDHDPEAEDRQDDEDAPEEPAHFPWPAVERGIDPCIKLSIDVIAVRRAGFGAHWFNRHGSPPAQLLPKRFSGEDTFSILPCASASKTSETVSFWLCTVMSTA